jgi:hypothetical protein
MRFSRRREDASYQKNAVFSDADKDWYKNYFVAVWPKLIVGGCLQRITCPESLVCFLGFPLAWEAALGSFWRI